MYHQNLNYPLLQKFLAIFLIFGFLWFLRPGLVFILQPVLWSLMIASLFKPLVSYMQNHWELNKQLAIWLNIFLSSFAVMLPLILLYIAFSGQVNSFLADKNLQNDLREAISTNPNFENLEVLISEEDISTAITNTFNFASSLAVDLFSSLSNFAVILVVYFFLLYYLLATSNKDLEKLVVPLIPFSDQNSLKLIRIFPTQTKSIILSTVIMALIQGLSVYLIFVSFGLPRSVFWGLIGGIMSFIPLIGPSLIAAGGVVVGLISGSTATLVAMIILLLILQLQDNVLRPFIQNKFGQIHPLISVLGFVVGLNTLGLLGVLLGPVIISYLLSIIQYYIREYGQRDPDYTLVK